MGEGEIRCPGCGILTGPGDRFCRYCGRSLARSSRMRGYRHITALYTDLTRYTALTSMLDPEDLKPLMDTLFLEATRVITSFGGIMEKVSGDGAAALFGVHHIHEDDIIRAVRCALAIHGFVEKLKVKAISFEGERLSMHTGIHTGTVFVDQESSSPLSLGTVGMPIIYAKRLSDLAASGEILIDDTSRNEVERFFHIEPLGEKDLEGIMDRTSVYRIGRQRRMPLSIHRPSRVNSAMVGREGPLSLLMKELDLLLQGRASTVLVTGEAGVGKSRLVHEFGKLLPEGVSFITLQCLDHMKDTPYFPVVSMIRQILDFMGQGNEDLAIETLLANPGHAFHIRSLIESRPADDGLMPDMWKTEILEAVTALMSASSGIRPLVLCVEDMHWADATSRDLFENLFGADDGGIRCLFVITSRQDRRLRGPLTSIPLQELSREHTKVLLEGMLGNNAVSPEALDALYRITGGNPFYIEEYVSYLSDKGRSPLRRIREKKPDAVPSTIQGLIAARLEALKGACRHILQEASVIGTVFAKPLLKAITSSEAEVEDCLRELEQAGFISCDPSGEYAFRHALTREVVSMSMLKDRRIELHRRVGFELERIFMSRTGDCGMIALHLFRAREYARAYPYCIRAAGIYQTEGSWIEAVTHYKMAEESLKKTSGMPGRDEMLIRVYEGIWSCARIFSPDDAVHALEELVECYARAGRKSQEIFTRIRLINLYSQKALFEKALRVFEEVSIKARGNGLLMAAAKTVVAYTYTFLGRPLTALEYLEEARCGLDSSDKFLLSVNYLTTLAAWVWRGSVKDALVWYGRTKQICRPYMDIDLMAETWLGYVLFLKGDITGGRRIFDEIRAREKRLGSLAGGFSYLRIQSAVYLYSRYLGQLDRAGEELGLLEERVQPDASSPALARLYHAWITIEQERYGEARDLLKEALPFFESGVANRMPYALNTLAEALVMTGDLDGAERALLKSIDWNEENGNTDQLIWALRIMGDLRLRQGRPEDARRSFTAGFRTARRCDMKPHVAWTLASWGDYHALCGRWEKAHACYARAISLWRSMGSPYQAAKIERKPAFLYGKQKKKESPFPQCIHNEGDGEGSGAESARSSDT